MENKSLLMIITVLIFAMNSTAQETGVFTDARDGTTYKTVKIGTHTWMAENMNYETDTGSWIYDNDLLNAEIYGRLYDWETALKVCPAGWHLPSNSEWIELTDSLGGRTIAGGKMKIPGTDYWKTPNTGATNESVFSALPGGYRYYGGSFLYIGKFASFYSSTEKEGQPGYAWFWNLFYDSKSLTPLTNNGRLAYSVRCVKD
ncbi:MAG: fibrobacter succinogenes major paralogous domain-containing protein [Bacteroidales bacterium]|nr:fibrobacter succinogenes major paralogous domain-containing protein [Bacteroidales bacterium]